MTTATADTAATHGLSGKVQDEHAISPGEIAIGVIIGRTSEFFDFFTYAIASVLVFPKLIFPYMTSLHATLWSFAIFPLAFVARPVGSFFFMRVDRLYGRTVKLTIALFLLGGSTAAIAFLPGYAAAGTGAALALAVLRLGQGFALGGSWDGLASLLAMNAPEGRRGWYAMIPQLGAPLGLVVASGLFAFLLSVLPEPDFYDWGWRFPFFVAFAINVVALFARLRIVATPEFQRLFASRDLQPEPPLSTLRTEWRTIVIGAFAPLASLTLFHMVTVFPMSYVYLFTNETPETFLLIELGSAVLGVGAIIASGVLADRLGRRLVLGGSAVVMMVFSGFAPNILSAGMGGEIAFMVTGFLILGVSFGQSSGAVAANFPTRHRYTGSALTSDLAWLIGAGFSPLIALYLASNFGLMASGAFLLSGAVATLVALWFNQGLGAGKMDIGQ